MKKFYSLIAILNISIHSFIIAQSGPPACNDFMTLNGRDFYCGGNKFYPFVCNYLFTIAHNSGLNNDGVSAIASDYYISPYNGYGKDETFECTDQLTCSQRLSDDFSKIHQLGFNAIKTGVFCPGFDFTNHTKNGETFLEFYPNKSESDFGIWATCNGCPGTCYCGKSLVFSTDPVVADDNRNRFLGMIDVILETAYNNSLKVFLDVVDAKSLDTVTYPDYLNWLTILSEHIKNLPLHLRKTLAAYVVLHEPFLHMTGIGYDKHSVCEKTTEMYDLIKLHDPEHLITLGSGEPTSILNWDSGVMKYDFVSPHIYPFQRYAVGAINNEINSDNAVERVFSQLYWLKKYCPYPFMIGETGFDATDDAGINYTTESVFPAVNGKIDYDPDANYNQKNYFHDVIKMTRDCFGSGFSVWQFQENSYFQGNRDGYGILRVPLTPTTNINKPVCDEFLTYLDANGLPPDPDLSGGQMPAYYYDPYHYGTSLPGGINGFVQDSVTGDKIKGAFIIGSVGLPVPGLGTVYSHNYTFSREEQNQEGEFYIIPKDWYNGQVLLSGFSDFYISAVGTSRLHFGGDQSYGFVSDASNIIGGNTYLLNRNMLNNRNNINNITLSALQNENFKGFSSLTVGNFIAESQSSADLKGSFEVTLNNESDLKNGSEIFIHTGQVFPVCTEFSLYNRLRGPITAISNQTQNIEGNIELDFKINKNKMFVYPNPTSGIINFSFTKNEIPFSEIKIQNVLGSIVAEIKSVKQTFSLDLSFLPKGLYFITGSSDIYRQSLKLIIN